MTPGRWVHCRAATGRRVWPTFESSRGHLAVVVIVGQLPPSFVDQPMMVSKKTDGQADGAGPMPAPRRCAAPLLTVETSHPIGRRRTQLVRAPKQFQHLVADLLIGLIHHIGGRRLAQARP